VYGCKKNVCEFTGKKIKIMRSRVYNKHTPMCICKRGGGQGERERTTARDKVTKRKEEEKLGGGEGGGGETPQAIGRRGEGKTEKEK